MAFIVDMGTWSWKQASAISYGASKWAATDRLAENGAKFCCDSRNGIRAAAYPSYKANRKSLPAATLNLAILARDWMREARKRYDLIYMDGLEADDVCATISALDNNPKILSTDKDYMQLPAAELYGADLLPWGIERIQKKTKLPLRQGSVFLAYQLLYGDVSDGIPRALYSYDRTTGPYVFSCREPLIAAIEMLPEDVVRERLNLLMIPTPLFTGTDPIDEALHRYQISLTPR